MLCSERSSLTPLNNQLPVPTRQNSIKSFRSLSSHNGYVPVDQQDVVSAGAGSGSGSGPRMSLYSRQSSFRSVVGSLLFDGQTSPHATDYQHNDLSPPEQPLDDLKDGCEICDRHRDGDTEASSSNRLLLLVVVVVVLIVVVVNVKVKLKVMLWILAVVLFTPVNTRNRQLFDNLRSGS